jgi:hypothetical protein
MAPLDDRRELLAAVDLGELLVKLTGIEARGHSYPCPSSEHDQTGKSPPVSLRAKDGYGLWHCPVCDKGGTAIDALVARGSNVADAFEELHRRTGIPRRGGGGGANPPNPRAHVHMSGCTVEEYAAAKGLPADFLRELGITDYKDSRFPSKVLRIPYRDAEGNEPATRIRKELHKRPDGNDGRFLWKKHSKLCLYGLWRQPVARLHVVSEDAAPPHPLLLVEGESDCHTLWHHGIPALGLPGAGAWKEDRDLPHLNGVERVYVVIEPDQGGDAVLGWLSSSKLRDRAWLVEVPGGDVSALHLADPEHFKENLQQAVDAAEPWRSRAAEFENAERRELRERCASLAHEPRILDRFIEDLRARGIVGEERLAKLTYLAVTSRLFDRIVSEGVKGPSAAGKSIVVERTLEFFPPSAFYVLTAMSERGLIFISEDMRHRMLVLFEAAGMSGDMQSYLIRSLLSEGRIRYQMPTKGDGGEIEGRLVELEGPTGLIVTTTAISMHPENETRLLSITATDTQEQTALVLAALADEDLEEVDLEPWRALQRLLELGTMKVTIPFAKRLARLVPPVAVRLRRDFSGVLGLIRAHALLHQATRERDDKGRIVATIEDDYAVIRDLVADLVSEGVQATVTAEVRQAVEAVAGLKLERGASRGEIAKELKLDPSAAGRRLQAARAKGYLRNLEERKGHPARWILGDPLPEDKEILPTLETLTGGCARVHDDPGGSDPPTPTEDRRSAKDDAVGTLIDAIMAEGKERP